MAAAGSKCAGGLWVLGGVWECGVRENRCVCLLQRVVISIIMHVPTPPQLFTSLSHTALHHIHHTAMAPRAARAAAAQASRPRGTAFPPVLLVVALLAWTVSCSSPLLPRPLGLGFVPSPQQHQQPSPSSSSSCCGGRHHASHTHQHPHARPAAATTKLHALPPFDSPLDPTTLESMAAAASSAAASTGGALNEVTPEQLWVRSLKCVCVWWAAHPRPNPLE